MGGIPDRAGAALSVSIPKSPPRFACDSCDWSHESHCLAGCVAPNPEGSSLQPLPRRGILALEPPAWREHDWITVDLMGSSAP